MSPAQVPPGPQDQSAAQATRWVPVVCFVSGAAGLIFEMVWFHRSGLVFGSSVWATSLVLSSFMGGLTIGSAIVGAAGHRIRSILRAYAAAEIVVAMSGVALTYALPGFTRAVVALTNPTADNLWLINGLRFLTAFTILLVPSTAMGTTLPLLVAALARGRRFGAALGNAYGWNTLGAVAGVLGTEVLLIGTFGVAGSAWVAAALSLGAAATALSLSRSEHLLEARAFETAAKSTTKRTASDPRSAPQHVRTWPFLASSFLSGATLLALEVVWFRFLTMYVLSTTLAASLMLAVVLAGIGVGGLAASAWLKWNRNAAARLPLVAFGAGCAVVASYAAFQLLTDGAQIAAWHRTLWLACVLTLPASALSGVFFTLLGEGLQRAIVVGSESAVPAASDLALRNPPAQRWSVVHTRAAGWLTLANTAGGMCGPLVAAFVLLPAVGMEDAFFTLAAAYVGIGVLATGAASWRAHVRSPALVMGGIAIAVALAWFPFGLMRDVYFARVVRPYAADGSSIVAAREGPSETILADAAEVDGRAGLHASGDQRLLDVGHGRIRRSATCATSSTGRCWFTAARSQRAGGLLRRRRDGRRRTRHPRRRSHRRRRDLCATSSR